MSESENVGRNLQASASSSDLSAPTTPGINRRRWLLATLATLCAGAPVLVVLARRWNRRTCEIVVDWPDSKPANARWHVKLDQYGCDFAQPASLQVRPQGGERVMCIVEFKSSGAMVQGQRLALSIEVLDATGRVLASEERVSTPYGSVGWAVPGDANLVPFSLTVKERAARVRISFRVPA